MARGPVLRGRLRKHTCQTTIPKPSSSVKLREKALSRTPAPRPRRLPSEICFTAAGLRVRPSVVKGVWASREWVYEGEVSYLTVVRKEGVKKGREKPKARRSGRALVRNLKGVSLQSRGKGRWSMVAVWQ